MASPKKPGKNKFAVSWSILSTEKNDIGEEIELILIYLQFRYPVFFFSGREISVGQEESPGGSRESISLLNLFDPPQHDSYKTIRSALNLGMTVKMIINRKILLS